MHHITNRGRRQRGRPLHRETLEVISRTPISFWTAATGEAAWSAWYGSREAMCQIRAELLETGVRFDGHSRSQQKLMPSGQFLSTMLLNNGRQRALEESLGAPRYHEIRPESSLAEKIRGFIGESTYNSIQHDLTTLPADALYERVKACIPQIAEMFLFGGFSLQMAKVALELHAVLEASGRPWDSREDLNLDLVLHLLVMSIPVFLIRECLIASYSRIQSIYPIAGLFAESDEFDGVDHRSPLFDSEPEIALALAADIPAASSTIRFHSATDYADFYLESAQAFLLSATHDGGSSRAISTVCEEGRIFWKDAIEVITKMAPEGSALARLESHAQYEPPNHVATVSHEILLAARTYNKAVLDLLTSVCNEDDDDRIDIKLSQVKQRIAEIAAAPSADGYKELGELSQQASALTEENNKLLLHRLDQLDLFRRHAEEFKQAGGCAVEIDPKQLDADKVGTEALADTQALSRSDIEIELLEANSRLEEELRVSKAENRRLESLVTRLHDRSPEGANEELVELARRQALGQTLNPEQILRFYQLIGSDRVDILDSAWKSARDSMNFKEPGRLFEMLGKLVFDYLDGVRAGEPMGALGIQLFAGGFAAKESLTVQRDVRMRAQREFSYRGESRFFAYRLRIANGWGPVEGMRLYFDVLDDRLVIAYVGEHLEQASTN